MNLLKEVVVDYELNYLNLFFHTINSFQLENIKKLKHFTTIINTTHLPDEMWVSGCLFQIPLDFILGEKNKYILNKDLNIILYLDKIGYGYIFFSDLKLFLEDEDGIKEYKIPESSNEYLIGNLPKSDMKKLYPRLSMLVHTDPIKNISFFEKYISKNNLQKLDRSFSIPDDSFNLQFAHTSFLKIIINHHNRKLIKNTYILNKKLIFNIEIMHNNYKDLFILLIEKYKEYLIEKIKNLKIMKSDNNIYSIDKKEDAIFFQTLVNYKKDICIFYDQTSIKFDKEIEIDKETTIKEINLFLNQTLKCLLHSMHSK